MPRLRPKQQVEPAAPGTAWAICTEGYRSVPFGMLFERGDRRPLDHPAVTRNPEYWARCIPLVEEQG